MSESHDDENIFVVFTDSAEDADEAFNRWYEEHHIEEILGVDGFVWAQRYKLHADQRPGMAPPAWRYLALYGLEGVVADIHPALKAASAGFVHTDALRKDTGAWVFEPIGPRVKAHRNEGERA